MFRIVTITKQGEISIPTSFWKKFNLTEGKKVYIRAQDNKLILEPVADLLDQAGTLTSKRLKGKSADEVSKIEKRAMADGFAGKFKPLPPFKSYEEEANFGDTHDLTEEWTEEKIRETLIHERETEEGQKRQIALKRRRSVVARTAGLLNGGGKALTAEEERAAAEQAIVEEATNRSSD